MKPFPPIAKPVCAGMSLLIATSCVCQAESLTEVASRFVKPGKEYATAPLWVWNDLLTEEQSVQTMSDLASQSVMQVFVHPRPGLMTEYLSDDWFRLWEVALREAERLDMNVWIYDENSYPSGFAGGHVLERSPDLYPRVLTFDEVSRAPAMTDATLAVYRLTEDGFESVTPAAQSGTLSEGRYLVVTLGPSESSAWYGGKSYVDLARRDVTDTFLDVTLGAYQQRLGSHLGKRIPGSFTDEPRLNPRGGPHWTKSLPETFREAWGYDIVDHLPSLVRPVGDWKRIRHNYYQVLNDMFIDAWAIPYYEHCEKLGLEATGHYWEHEWPNCAQVPDNMAMGAWQHRPGIDMLFNQYGEGVHAQFGNVRSVIELASVANQMGRARTLCETYGGGGWDLRFEDMKRIGDWIAALGINTIDEHLSHITIRGARKRDYPQSFSYHEPWWDSYHVVAQYLTRLCCALSSGQQLNRILVLEPTTTAWMYQGDDKKHLDEFGESFQRLVTKLAKAQIEFDLGSEDIVRRVGSRQGKCLRVGARDYDVVVIPALTENLNAATVRLLDECASNGVTVYACTPVSLERIDGAPTDRFAAFFSNYAVKQVDCDLLDAELRSAGANELAIDRAAGDAGILYHHRRALDDGQLLFLVNTSIDQRSSGTVNARGNGVTVWNLQTGATDEPYPFERTERGVAFDFEIEPSGSLLVAISKTSKEALSAKQPTESAIDSSGSMAIQRDDLNVLTLDYVDVRCKNESLDRAYFHDAAAFVFKRHGLEQNPWDSAVQFKTELVSRTFPEESGFQATYRFEIRDNVPETLEAVIERTDLYSISCNGVPVAATNGDWWLDRAFGCVDIRAAARVGQNEIRLEAKPFQIIHELESIYIRGTFSLAESESGFAIAGDRPLELGAWNTQGHPFYGHRVSYESEYNVTAKDGRYLVRLGPWYGSVASVAVNGKPCGHIGWRPWEVDVTDCVKDGANTVRVTVTGTLKNTLGPHHGNPPLGFASPGSFRKAPKPGPPPGSAYHTVGYGLFEPFALVQRK